MLKTSYLNGGQTITADAMNAIAGSQTLLSGLRKSPVVTYNTGNTLTLTDFQGVLSTGATCKYTNQGELVDLSDVLGIPVHTNSNSYQGTLVCAVDPDMYVESRIFTVSGLLTQAQADASNYLVLAWFMYPGNNVALSSSQWISYPTARQDHWLDVKTVRDFDIPAPLAVTANSTISNPGSQDITFNRVFLIPVTDHQARTFRVVGEITAGCYVRATVSNAETSETGLRTISSTSALAVPVHGYADTACLIPRQVITTTKWGYLMLSVSVTVGAGASMKLNALGLTTEVTV